MDQVRYTGGPDDAEVILYTLSDAGHTWPGGVPLPEAITGPTSDAIDATRTMWDFFTRHPNRRCRARPRVHTPVTNRSPSQPQFHPTRRTP